MKLNDDIIDHNLNELFLSGGLGVSKFTFSDLKGIRISESTHLQRLLIDKGLITVADNNEWCRLTKFGYEVSENGGYLKHLIREKFKAERQDEKDEYDFKMSKWKYRTFWFLLAISIAGFSMALYNFIKSQNTEIHTLEKQ